MDAGAVSESNLVDEIIEVMSRKGIIKGLTATFEDRRERRAIPFGVVMALSIAAKMKVATSMTDIPFAIKRTQTLAELGYCLWENERELGKGLMDEGTIRTLVGKYEPEEWINDYNQYITGQVFEKMSLSPDIHILDCTKIEVNLKNENYEGAGYAKDQEGEHRGYKLATLRGICGDRGIIEAIRFGSIETHDFKLSEEMIRTTSVLKTGDILIEDRGFISREMLNYLKAERGVSVYIPVRNNMEAYEVAVSAAKMEKKWYMHPNKKREGQEIAFVKDLGKHWTSKNPEQDVPINGCVVWDRRKGDYYVFVTTDMEVTGRQLIRTYELRPEIEEDYRQIKDFWKIEGFHSRKLTVTVFHIVSTLLGYLYFQLYTLMNEGAKWARKSLPVAIKKYVSKEPVHIIVCVGQEFATFPLLEFMQLYASFGADVRARLDLILALV
jgi:hypothetical protein